MVTSKTNATPGFAEALAEVETILARLEGDEIDIDDLSTEVKRAVALVDACREKLRATELEVKSFVDALNEADTVGGEPPAAD